MLKINTIRRKFIVGLIPGFAALTLITGIGYYGLQILAQANARLVDTVREMDAIKSLQLSAQQALMPPNDYLILGGADDKRALFQQLAQKVDEQLVTARPRFEEDSEQRLLDQAVVDWNEVRQRSEAIFARDVVSMAAQLGFEVEALDAVAASMVEKLEWLHDLVYEEMEAVATAVVSTHRTATWLLFISATISVTGGVLFTILFSRHLADPIITLCSGAARIGAGDLDFRLNIQSADELGMLAMEFNRMAEKLQDLYTHLEERVAARTAQLRALDEAGRAVASELDLDKVLQTIVNLSLELSGASYAAVLIPRRDGDQPHFLTARANGVSSTVARELSGELDLLNAFMKEGKPVRWRELPVHSTAAALPPDHLPIQGFLGVPITAHEQIIGALYVIGRADRRDFTQEDEQVMTMLAAHAAVAIENARLYGEIRAMNEVLEARVQERAAQLRAVSEERGRYAEALRQVLERTVRLQEEERERIAKEVHDGVSQWLMAALYELQAAKVYLRDQLKKAVGHLDEAQAMLKRVKEELRRVIYDLHPPLLESNGLVAALRAHAADFQAVTGILCQVHVLGEPRRLAPEQELALYRITQEALHNVAKHAEARRAKVTVDFAIDAVQLCVTDDGRGFDPAQTDDRTRSHLGLLGMRERAYSVGGTLGIHSSPGKGTTITVHMPLNTG